MKKLSFMIIGLLLCFSACNKKSSAIHDTANNESESAKAQSFNGEIVVVITLGVNMDIDGVHFECVASGPICSVGLGPDLPNAPKIDICDGLAAVSENNKLIIKYDKSTLPSSIKSEFFVNGLVNQPGTVFVDSAVCAAVGLPEGYTILPGQYHYTEDDQYINVQF